MSIARLELKDSVHQVRQIPEIFTLTSKKVAGS